ncbi:MAG: hypothetical protein QF464_22960, partial [Myxococcota bacterium]|nr:hypothetical protein [Myxococcota bacterium]
MNRLTAAMRFVIGTFVVCCMAFASPTAFAQKSSKDDADAAAAKAAAEEVKALAEVIRVIQQRPVIRAGRFEVQTLFGVGMADTMFRHMAPVLNARYHINERWSVGGSGAYYFPDTHG